MEMKHYYLTRMHKRFESHFFASSLALLAIAAGIGVGIVSTTTTLQASTIHSSIQTNNTTMAPKTSALQLQVLSLYRKFLRQASAKDRDAHVPASFVDLLSTASHSSTRYAASEFRKQAKSVPKSDFRRIEYMIRKGEKHLKLLKMPGVKVVSGVTSGGIS
jgi:Complex 1 protein (LYR family)